LIFYSDLEKDKFVQIYKKEKKSADGPARLGGACMRR
jgi:hypothetical protein